MAGASSGSHTASTGGPVSDCRGGFSVAGVGDVLLVVGGGHSPRAGVVTGRHPVGDRGPWPVEVATVGEGRTARAKGVDERECRRSSDYPTRRLRDSIVSVRPSVIFVSAG
jgi:hypothetical protein